MGRGLTNAKQRFTSEGDNYATDGDLHNNVDMVGLIFVPYDDGQYSINTQWSVAKNIIGFSQGDIQMAGAISQNMNPFNSFAPFASDVEQASYAAYYAPTFQDVGDLELANVMFKANGIGNEINDFLDNTNLVVSWAQSKTKPNSLGMLGSTDSQTGHSEYVALNMPAGEDARFGLEWNQGSKYWRSVTYGEDTMVGSKLAARGSAVEAYYNRTLTKALSMSLRATKIDYDYAGSNSFFGFDGNPDGIGADYVTEAKDIRLAINYRY